VAEVGRKISERGRRGRVAAYGVKSQMFEAIQLRNPEL